MTQVDRDSRQHLRTRKAIERHFQRRVKPTEEREMRAHIVDCDECRQHYEAYLAFSQIDPDAAGPEARLATGLGLQMPRASPARNWAVGLGFAGAFAATVLLVAQAAGPGATPAGETVAMARPAENGFAARGTDATRIDLFRVQAAAADDSERLVPLDGAAQVRAGDELALSYRNGAGKANLMVFGIDATGEVHWYLPEWTDPSGNPAAVAIEAGAEAHPVSVAVAHRFATGPLRIVSLFTDRPLRVQEVEAALRAPGASLQSHIATLDPNAVHSVHALEVLSDGGP